MKFRVRIDGSTDDEVVTFVAQYYRSVIVHHILPHGNPHYHMFVEDTMSLSIDAFRARVKRVFKPESRSDYSVKICDDDKENEYISYLFNTKHGNQSRLVSHNVSPALIDQCKQNASDISEDFKQRQAIRKSKGVTIYDISEQLGNLADDLPDIPNVKWYTENAIKLLHDNRKTCEPNMLIKIVSTAMSFRDKDRLVKKVQFYFQSE